jgi:4-hydroxybenzoate polyprenyltransferase
MEGGPEVEHLEERLSRRIDAFVAFLEKTRLPLLGTFLYVILAALVRDLSEYYLLDTQFVNTPHPWIYSIAHHVSFYVVVFLGLVLLLSAFSGRGVRRSINFISSFYWIILLPPYIDHFVFGSNENYAYFSPTEFANALLRFSGETFHPGQALEVIFVLFALFSYAIWTQRHRLQTIKDRAVVLLRIAFLIFFTFLAMFVMATPGAFIPVGSHAGIPDFPAFDLTSYFQMHLFLFAWYLVIGVALVFAIIYIAKKAILRRLVASLRPFQTLFFMGIVAAGIVIGWGFSASLALVTSILNNPYWVNLAFAGISIVSAMLAWQVSTMWNDLSDRATDAPSRGNRVLASGLVSERDLRDGSSVLLVVSLACAALLSLQQAALLLVIFALSFIYSFRPVRFKEHILSPALIGLGTFLAFLFGYLTPYSVVARMPTPDGGIPYLSGEVVSPTLTHESFLIGFFIFVGLAVGSMVTDIEGYEEDGRARVRTIYTSMGVERGKTVVALLIWLAALTPLFLFHTLPDALVFVMLGSVGAVLFHREGRSRPVLMVAMIGLVYAALRYLGLFGFS